MLHFRGFDHFIIGVCFRLTHLTVFIQTSQRLDMNILIKNRTCSSPHIAVYNVHVLYLYSQTLEFEQYEDILIFDVEFYFFFSRCNFAVNQLNHP